MVKPRKDVKKPSPENEVCKPVSLLPIASLRSHSPPNQGMSTLAAAMRAEALRICSVNSRVFRFWMKRDGIGGRIAVLGAGD